MQESHFVLCLAPPTLFTDSLFVDLDCAMRCREFVIICTVSFSHKHQKWIVDIERIDTIDSSI